MKNGSDSEAKNPVRHNRSTRLNSDDDIFERISKKYYQDRERRTVKGFITRFSTEPSTDSPSVEPPQPTVEDWNFEILYGQVLVSLLNIVEDKENLESNSLVEYLQRTFEIGVDSHKRLLAAAMENQHALVLNVGVVEAKGLRGKDANGLSDPFCVLYVSSEEKQHTLVKNATLDPVWKDHFCFPIKNAQEDFLNVEVWDFDPVESLSQKVRGCSEVDSLKGFRNYLQEVAKNVTGGKQTNGILGYLKIPLKDIPAAGWENWFHLLNASGKRKKGEIYLQIVKGVKKDKKVALKEYRHVMYLILAHELVENRSQQYSWDGKFSTHGEFILRQLRLQGGFLPLDVALAQWRVYTRFHTEHPLNAELFIEILKVILPSIDADQTDPHEVEMFWLSCKQLVKTLSIYVENRYQYFWDGSVDTVQIQGMIRTMKLLIDYLFSVSNKLEETEKLISVEYIANTMEIAVTNGAEEMYGSNLISLLMNTLNSYKFSSIKNDTLDFECEADVVVKIGQKLAADLEQRFEILNADFSGLNALQYYDTVYRVYDRKFQEVLEPVAKKLGKKLESLEVHPDQTLAEGLGASALELYRAVKAFADLSKKLKSEGELHVHGSYHRAFYSSVVYWLEKARSEAERRIEKAINLDTFTPVSDSCDESKISSSAVDTLLVFQQIFIFWNQISWPDVQESYAITLKIVDDVVKLVAYYTNIMKNTIMEELGREKSRHEIRNELCFTVTNIEYVSQESVVLIRREVNKVFNALADAGTPKVTECFAETLDEVFINANQRIKDTCHMIMENGVLRIETVIHKGLTEYVKTMDERVCVNLYDYLDETCKKLENKLFEESYKKIVSMIWRAVSKALKVSVETCVRKRKPPQVFLRIERITETIFQIIFPRAESDGISICGSEIQEVQNTIKLYKATTDELILMYWRERLKQQSDIKRDLAGNGNLNFRVAYYKDEEVLRVGVIHCQRLKACDRNGLSDPYVKIEIITRESRRLIKLKTKVQYATLFPIFDETFSITLSRHLLSSVEFLHFSVKDYDRMKRNDLIGEGLLGAESIPSVSSDVQLMDLPQIDLPLSTPNDGMSELLQALESRWEDEHALKFAKKERFNQRL